MNSSAPVPLSRAYCSSGLVNKRYPNADSVRKMMIVHIRETRLRAGEHVAKRPYGKLATVQARSIARIQSPLRVPCSLVERAHSMIAQNG